MWASAGLGTSSSSPKQWKSDGRFKIYNSVSARLLLTKYKKKEYRERSFIKSARVSALTGLVPRKMAEEQKSISVLIRNRTQVDRLSVTHLNSYAINPYHGFEITGMWLVVFRHLQPIFFAYRTVVLRLFKLNIKARHEIPEFLNANLWSIHFIAFDIG